jgi:transcriptional regulator with XRE-family HTH domain
MGKSLADALVAARNHASLSLADLAERIGGLTRQALGHYESGVRMPPAERIEQIATACSVAIEVGPDGVWSWRAAESTVARAKKKRKAFDRLR